MGLGCIGRWPNSLNVRAYHTQSVWMFISLNRAGYVCASIVFSAQEETAITRPVLLLVMKRACPYQAGAVPVCSAVVWRKCIRMKCIRMKCMCTCLIRSGCPVDDTTHGVQAQKQVMRRFEKYLAGAPVKTNLDLPPAPSTPPLSDDVPGWDVATSPAPDVRASLEPAGVCKKQQQDSCSTEERKRKSHLISASPPASPAVPAAVQGDVAAPCSTQVNA